MSPRLRVLSTLPRHLALGYSLLIVYACLSPFTGWRLPGLPLLDYLTAPWPRYFTWLDIIFNVLGFFPFGFFLAPVLGRRLPMGWAFLLATLTGATLSLGLESVQNFLPTRVASNVDLGCNSLGALLGALAGARWGPALFDRRGGLHRWRQRRVLAGRLGNVGLILLGLWLLAQLTPVNALFATGDLRELLDLPPPLPFDPRRYLRLEAAVAATSLLAVGLLARQLMRQPGHLAVLALVLAGIATKTLATASFFVPGEPLHWATPGALAGLGLGSLLLALALALPTGLRQGLASLTLLAATALANLMPENPFLASGSLIREGHFLNFHGLTQLVGALWPFLALAQLSALGRRVLERRNAPPTPPPL
jgi:VanZ family protein